MLTPDRISIAKDFSPYPAGRTAEDGSFNGTNFRQRILGPRLKKAIEQNTLLIVDLEGIRTAGSSFLDEAFGGIVRDPEFDKRKTINTLKISYVSSRYKRYASAIEKYMAEA